jgi:hypothetical protein
MPEPMRVVLAILVAAAMPGFLFAVVSVFDAIGQWKYYPLLSIRPWFAITFPVALAHALFLGLPAFLLLRWLRLTGWYMSLICGFVIGAIGPLALAPWLISGFGYDKPTGLHDVLMSGLPFGLLGMACGFAAWLAWRFSGPHMSDARSAE